MLRSYRSMPAFAGCFLAAIPALQAITLTEDFAGDPRTNGWAVFGDASLFVWDTTNQQLQVTWDSTRTNSYFHHPLGATITRRDDFHIELDLRLDDCVSGHEPGKTGPLQIGIGLFNRAGATSASFCRGTYGGAPDVVEFNYFPYGYYTFGEDIYVSDATTVVDFVSSSGYAYTPTYFDPIYEFEIPTNQRIRVVMNYAARNQTLVLTLLTNNAVLYQPPPVVLDDPGSSGFGGADDYQVDTFSISSYSSHGDPYNSVLGHGMVDNIFVHIPPVQDFTGAFTNGVWQAQFRSRSNWVYTLERTLDFSAWTNVSATVSGTAANLLLQDAHPPHGQALYRVRAEQP